MMKVKYYKCPICPGKVKFKTLNGWGDHMKKHHPESIPEGYSIARYFYYVLTGKTHGICRTCKGVTEWNEKSMKYSQYCPNPKCKEAYVNIAKTRMVNKYGQVHLLNDPEMQRKMMSNRRISGTWTFHDGVTIGYVASYEKNFLKMMDRFLHWPGSDIIGPSPHNYEYEYKNPNDNPENEGMKIYIPDYYIPTLNLEIEIKQTQTTHPKLIAIDQVKERLKDEVMHNNPNVNYIKITDNDFSGFFNYLLEIKEKNLIDTEQKKTPIEKAVESYLSVNEIIDIESEAFEDTNSLFHLFDKVRMKFSQIDVVYKKMCKLKIGYVRDGIITYGEKNIENYRTEPLDIISDKKFGLHFDFTQYLVKQLSKFGYSFQNYYVQFDNDMTKSHTFTAIKIEDGYLYIETYRNSIAGVYYPVGIDDIINFILTDMMNQYNSDKFKIYSYYIQDKVYPGRTLQEIVKYITINGSRVYHIYSDLYSIVKVDPKK